MSWLRQITYRISALLRRRQLEQDMAEEMRLHLELRQERNAAAGMSSDEAQVSAQRSFGGMEQIKERCRDEQTSVWLEQGIRDVRYAVRSLRQAPGFFAVAALTLALGIGVNAVMFSLVRDHFLRPLLRDERLNLVSIYTLPDESARTSRRLFSFAEFETLRTEKQIFSDVTAMGFASLALGNATDTKRSLISFVAENYFALLDVAPADGRFFTAEEARPNANLMVAVASHSYWNRIGRPANIVGSKIRANGLEFTIVGLAPEGFGGLHNAITPEIWLPLGATSQLAGFMGKSVSRDLLHPASYRLSLVGRLASGLSLDAAHARLSSLDRQLNAGATASERRKLVVARPSRYNFGSVQPDHPALAEFSRRATVIALGIAAAVMLVASLNVANLLLARGANRQKEFAVRLALGAPRGRVVRQLVTEGLVLGLTAAFLGVTLCAWSGDALRRWMIEVFSAGTFAFNPKPPIDLSVLGFTIAVTLLATLAFSLVPALRSTRVDLVGDLKRQPGSSPATGNWGRFFSIGNTLVMLQIALALALLFGAGLFVRAAQAAAHFNHGFRLEAGLVANIDFDFGSTPVAEVPRRQRAILQHTLQIPGVQRAALASAVPYNFERHDRGVFAVGADSDVPNNGQSSVYTAVTSDYFRTLGITLLRGRDFTAMESTDATSRPVAIIDETLGRRLFGDADPVGRYITTNRAAASGQNPAATIEIVGVVRSPHEEVFEESAPTRLYRPLGQSPATNTYLHVELAAGVAPSAMIERLRRELRTIEPENSVLLLRPLADFPRRNINSASIQMGAVLVAACAAVAFGLAVVGVYSVKAYAVVRRTREIGIRMALGARPAEVYRLVLAQGALQAAIGITAGAVLAVFTGKAAAHLLYRVSPNDWALLVFVSAVLAAAALAACFIPARRATKVDPLIALRCE
jgi:putative ABC transport system permease protein